MAAFFEQMNKTNCQLVVKQFFDKIR
jgi:hypothetical protein